LPGLYTPWTFPKAAAIENMGPIGARASYTANTCSGDVYSFSGSTCSLLTPSSSPPVIPISISSQIFMGAMRLKYSTQMAMFSSSGSSDKSSMCEP
jgi:hypothetical protein